MLIMAGLLMCLASSVFSQVRDTSEVAMSSGGLSERFEADTTVVHELSPLDITQDRGLFFVTPDGKMQLRILGSVRFSVLYDLIEFPVSKTFNTFYIPTGSANVKNVNYSNTLDMSRIGFEVTRKLATMDVFVRLESDFNGTNGQFRIRHAYGQTAHFLVGQTWSLFSNVSSLPQMVDPNGPTGSVTLRTPQIRYGHHNKRGTTWAVAFEYSQPDLTLQEFDTTGVSTVQLFPDLTGRIVRQGVFGLVQLSGVFTTISKEGKDNDVSYTFGYGASLSGTLNILGEHAILYQLTYGKAISRFITTFKGTGKDAVYNP
ncbi:MAG: DcaP family trimeric outer membrane transporter, partial [Bacteroidota bacterium]